MIAYYNDFDPKVCDWLEELISRGLIAPGVVDRRSILDVTPADLKGFTQCHFFAGIGGWSYALQLAGVDHGWPLWTGSPPCQPFSAAGRQLGKEDERHLAPHFAELVAACRPPILFGEQVASSAVFGKPASGAKRQDGSGHDWAWIDDLSDRLEAAHYAVGSSDIPAAFVGAPHIRQRTFFGAVRLADTDNAGPQGRIPRGPDTGRENLDGYFGRRDPTIGLADAHDAGPLPSAQRGIHRGEEGPRAWNVEPERSGGASGLADAARSGRGEERADGGRGIVGDSAQGRATGYGAGGRDSRTRTPDNPWRDADWLFCRDGKWRPVEPGSFPLAHGLPARVVRLRGYGNAIVPQAAALFIRQFLDAAGEIGL